MDNLFGPFCFTQDLILHVNGVNDEVDDHESVYSGSADLNVIRLNAKNN